MPSTPAPLLVGVTTHVQCGGRRAAAHKRWQRQLEPSSHKQKAEDCHNDEYEQPKQKTTARSAIVFERAGAATQLSLRQPNPPAATTATVHPFGSGMAKSKRCHGWTKSPGPLVQMPP